MKNLSVLLGVGITLLGKASAQQSAYGQCGGNNWTGATTCVSGYFCQYWNEWYSQCIPGTASSTSSTSSTSTRSSTSSTSTRTSTSSTSTSTSTSTTSTRTSTSATSSATGACATTGIEGYAAYGGTTGGAGGTTTRVTTLDALTSAVTGDSAKIVIIDASISGNTVIKVGSNTSIYGANPSITLTGVGLRIIEVSNVIVRNLKIAKVLADAGDALGIQEASKVWIDHVDLSSDMEHDKDYYDGLCDITHGSTYVTVSWSYLHDHWKSMLIGHSDSNESEDTAMTVTVHHNYWKNLNSRGPSFRFGTGHVYNNYYVNMNDGINTRVGAQLLVQNNVWSGTCSDPLYSTDGGYAYATGNDFGTCETGNEALVGTLTTVPYAYTLTPTANVPALVECGAGPKFTY